MQNEAERFQDIVQGNFIEAYKNLTYKHLMGLQWAVDKCKNNMDNNIIVNLYEAIVILQNKTKLNNNKPLLIEYILKHVSYKR
jgi:hypothetical protein